LLVADQFVIGGKLETVRATGQVLCQQSAVDRQRKGAVVVLFAKLGVAHVVVPTVGLGETSAAVGAAVVRGQFFAIFIGHHHTRHTNGFGGQSVGEEEDLASARPVVVVVVTTVYMKTMKS
jgi:hypothetical protein